MPNWEELANQMGQPFGGARAMQPQQAPHMDTRALVSSLTNLLFGGNMPPAPGANPAYQPPPANETWKRALSMGVDFAPGVGDVKALQEAIMGQNLVTGDKLGGWERALAGAGALPFLPNVAGVLGKTVSKAADWPLIKQAIEKIPKYKHGMGDTISALHKQFPNMGKAEFDEMVLGLAKEGKIALHQQDLPAGYKGEMIAAPSKRVGDAGKIEDSTMYYHYFTVKPEWR